MSLNIKNERVHDLVREAARRTGKSQTSVVEEALRRYLEELTRDSHDEGGRRLAEIFADLDALRAERPDLFEFDADALYDPETGLPA